MKKKIFICLSAICLSLFTVFPACTGDEDNSSGGGVTTLPPAQEEISTTRADYTLILGEGTYVIPEGMTNPSLQPIYVSSNEAIASVDENGYVTANGLGEATVTIRYGAATTSYTVKVESGNYVPSIHFNHVAGDEIQVSLMDRVNLGAYVNFNGKSYEDVTLTYTIDESYGTVEDGYFIPAQEGETTMTVQGTWRGFEGVTLEKTFDVTIVSAFEFYVNDGTEIYSTHNRETVGSTHIGETEIPFNIVCKENGEDVTDVTVTVIEGADVIAYDSTNKELKVVNEKTGNAKIQVKAKDSKQNEYVLSFIITVYESVSPEGDGFFKPIWIIEKENVGNFKPEWIL